MASLAGLEQAIEEDDEEKKELAIRRMMLLHGITLSIGGIPLLYLGEEWGMLNDYDFVKDPAKAGDSRWIHRPKMKWEFLEELDDHIASGNGSIRGRIFQSLKRLIALRQSLPALAGQSMELIPTDNEHVLGYQRESRWASSDCAGELFRSATKRSLATGCGPPVWDGSSRTRFRRRPTRPRNRSNCHPIKSSGFIAFR